MAPTGHNNINLIPNGLDSEPWTGQTLAIQDPNSTSTSTSAPTSTSTSPAPASPVEDMAAFIGTILRPTSLPRSQSLPHQIFPENLASSSGANFLDFSPSMESADEHLVHFWGKVVSLGPEKKTAVVRTLDGCDATCSTTGCQGMERLCEGQLVQICHHKSGEDEGKTFVTHTASECTPIGSKAGSRVGSRAPSRAPTRPPTPNGC